MAFHRTGIHFPHSETTAWVIPPSHSASPSRVGSSRDHICGSCREQTYPPSHTFLRVHGSLGVHSRDGLAGESECHGTLSSNLHPTSLLSLGSSLKFHCAQLTRCWPVMMVKWRNSRQKGTKRDHSVGLDSAGWSDCGGHKGNSLGKMVNNEQKQGAARPTAP